MYTSYYKKKLLSQIIFVSSMVSLSLVTKKLTNHIIKIPPRMQKFFIVDFLCVLPFLFLPLFTTKWLAFLGVFISEILSYLGSKNSQYVYYNYNPILSLTYGLCWGFFSFLFFKKNNSFYQVLLYLVLLWNLDFLLYYRLNFWCIQNNWFVTSNTQKILLKFNAERSLLRWFFTVFVASPVNAYLYLSIKKNLIHYFPDKKNSLTEI